MKKEKFDIEGMTCAACQANITRAVKKLDGIKEVNVNLLSNSMSVEYDDNILNSDIIAGTVNGIGYKAISAQKNAQENMTNDFRSEWHKRQDNADKEQAKMKRRLISSIILLIPLMYIAMGHMIGISMPAIFTGTQNALISAFTQLIISVAVILINNHFYINGFKALIKKAPNMDSLVAIGSAASLLYGIFAIYMMAYGMGHGHMDIVNRYSHELYFESCAMILTLVTVGKYLEAKSKSKTSDALGKLIDLSPKTAVVIKDGKEITIPAEKVAQGDIVVIRPGESIPVDGIVVEGSGYVDQAAITGESIPVSKQEGDTVISATINKNGTFRFKASKVGNDTTLAQIIRLVDEAGNTKAPIARLADKVSGVFVPIVIAIAIVTAIVWLATGYGFEFALSCAISVLVISCPCALGLATPVAIMAGTGKAAEYGILIKSAESLENLNKIDTVVLDKTGTITQGHPCVTDIIVLNDDMNEDEFLKTAASIEAGSEHPLARAIIQKAEDDNINYPSAEEFEMIAGRGVRAKINASTYFAGNVAFMKENAVFEKTSERDKINSALEKLSDEGKTPLLFADEQNIIGIIAVADTIKPSSISAVKRLTEMGLDVIMLTGDNKVTAEAIRKQIGIKKAIADVLPGEKQAQISQLQAEGHKVAMVGDGINDAPALMKADIGIAIGAGTDIAIDSADVVLMKDTLEDVPTAINLSKSVVRNIHMNLFWAFFYNVLGIPLAAGVLFPFFGIKLNPMIGSAAMSLSSLCVVTNALRLRFFKDKNSPDSNNKNEDNTIDEQPQISTVKGNDMMKKLITVEGMSCPHCQAHVKKALEEVEGVQQADVDLNNKTAAVTLSKDIDVSLLINAIEEAGYSATDCKDA